MGRFWRGPCCTCSPDSDGFASHYVTCWCATFLVAIGLAWPWLMLIVAPLLVAAILKRLDLGSVVPLTVASVLSVTVGVVVSWYYWHYPFDAPPLLQELREISAVEQISRVTTIGPDTNHKTQISVLTAIPQSSGSEPWGVLNSDHPTKRILYQFATRKMGIESSLPLEQALLDSLWRAAEKSGLLLDGGRNFPGARLLSGYAGIARLNDGSRIAFVVMAGNECSNDHYPYYDYVVRFDEPRFEIGNSQWFCYDVAGF